MSDLREQVADAIEPITGGNITTEQAADAAIAVVIEELAQRAEDEDQCLVSWHQVPGTRIPQEGDDLADWLRSQHERENTR